MRRARIAAALAGASLLATGCAPHVVRLPELDAGAREVRYRAALAARQGRGPMVEGEASLWTSIAELGRLPGAEARFVLAAPDGFRLRLSSAFGVALDLAARGDTLTAYVPARRLGLSVDAARESLGLEGPGVLVYRALSATWQPSRAAWSEGRWEDSLLVVRWAEGGDSLRLGVGADGLPRWVELVRPGGHVTRAAYRAWEHRGRSAWPVQVDLTDAAATFDVTLRVHRMRFAGTADRARVTPRMPAGAERLTLQQLRRVLQRLGRT